MKTGLVRIETDGDIAPSLYYVVTVKMITVSQT